MSLYQRMLAIEEKRKQAEQQPTTPVAQPEVEEQQQEEPVLTDKGQEPSKMDKFLYGFDSIETLSANIGDYLEARVPIGNISLTEGYISPEEIYGEGFMDMSVDERRVRIREVKEAQLAKEYPVITELVNSGEYESGAAGVTGTLVGALADPTTLLPVGNTVKGAAVIGGGLGAAWSIAEDLASKEGEIDVQKAIITGAASGVASGAIVRAAQAAKGYAAKRKDAKLVKQADEEVDKINYATAKAVANDVAEKDIPDFVQAEIGKSAEEVAEIVSIAKNKVQIPANKKAAELQVEAARISTDRSGFAESVDNLIGATSSRVKAISEPIFGRLREFEFNVSRKTHEYRQRVNPLIGSMKKVKSGSKDDYNKLSLHLMNGRMKEASDILRKYDPEAGAGNLIQTRNMLDEFYINAKNAGVKIEKVENYFPRTVKDHNAFVKSLGREPRTALENALRDKAKSLKTTVTKLDDETRADVINKFIAGTTKSPKGGYTKGRRVDAVTEDMLKLYDDPIDAINNHIRKAVNDIEKHNFFGKGNLVTGATNKLDVEESVGSLLGKEIDNQNITFEQADELRALLNARFIKGEAAPHKILRAIRDWGYAATLANPFSALIQLGDVGSAFYQNGIRNTASTMVKTAKSGKAPDMKELGLDDVINHELNTAMDSSKWLGRFLTGSGFRSMDRLGKNVFLRGAYKKATNQVKTKGGTAQLASKYRKAFGNDEFAQLVDELRAGEITDRVKLLMWHELSDIQPISLSEMPKRYLNHPDGRIFYALKSFTIKQLDMLRRGVIEEAKKGNYVEASKNAALFSLLVGGTNSVVDNLKQVAMGHQSMDDAIENIDDGAIEHLWRTAFMGDFTREVYMSRYDVQGAVAAGVSPPLLRIPVDIMKDFDAYMDKDKEDTARSIKYIPVVGKMLYNFWGGGMEKQLEFKEKKRRKERMEEKGY